MVVLSERCLGQPPEEGDGKEAEPPKVNISSMTKWPRLIGEYDAKQSEKAELKNVWTNRATHTPARTSRLKPALHIS